MQLFHCPDPETGFLSPSESHHCIRVLRKSKGDLLDITDGKGKFYKASLTHPDPKKCRFEILSFTEVPENEYFIHIAIAPAKNADRNDWFIEKAVELGIDKITFLESRYSERSRINIERANKKAVGAMKQSLRARLPVIDGLMKFDEFLMDARGDQKFMAHLDDNSTPYLHTAAKPGQHYVVLIGPEGGFSDEEIEEAKAAGYQSVRLGDHRLRTETAGLAACHVLNLINFS